MHEGAIVDPPRYFYVLFAPFSSVIIKPENPEALY